MLLQRLTQFILKRRLNAALLAILFAILPVLSWISGVIVALVTLRKGRGEGFIIMLWALLPALVRLFHNGLWVPFAATVLYGFLLVWFLAIILRRTKNWSLVIYTTVIAGTFGVLLIHTVIDNVASWWVHYFSQGFAQFEQSFGLPTQTQQNFQQTLEILSRVMTGLLIMFFSLFTMFELLIARALDSAFYSKRSLAIEFYQLRLHWLMTFVFLIVLFLAFQGSALFLDLLPVLTLPFLFAGVSLIHTSMALKKLAKIWFFVFYIVIVFAVLFFPILLVILILLAMLDSLFNFRKRWLNSDSTRRK